ncbi:hypothetical protein Dimus_013907 [Dionaea muscipula]
MEHMHNFGTSAQVDGARGRRTWQKFEEDCAIHAMRELVNYPKWKLDTGAFRSGFFVEVEKKLVKTFPGIDLRASPHIESKVKREPEAAHMRDKSWPYYDDWLVLFGKDKATGDLAEDAIEMVEMMTLEQTSVSLGDDLDTFFNNHAPMDMPDGSQSKVAPAVSTTATSKGGKKRGRVNEVATKCLTDMVTTFNKAFEDTNSSFAKIADSFSCTKEKGTKMEDLHKNLNDELAQLPLNLKQRIRALRLFTKDDTLVRLFYSMKDILERTELIEGLLEES